ncbi:MAG TPA: histidine phosphatase family protein [Candidatus Binataceae bacterium]|nr:histidine phosphatase family protein [Candidatus Binataceae bacterium]
MKEISVATRTLWLVRHGETPWSILGRHTGRTDLGLTSQGKQQAAALGSRLSGHRFGLILTSPLLRASETCRLAGYNGAASVEADLQEWDYGTFEGRTTADIRLEQPSWDLWNTGASGGETPSAVGRRADRVIARAMAAEGDVALFAHGHLLRVLAARWLGFAPSAGGSLALDTASVSVLGLERERRVIRLWNETCHLAYEQ